MLHKIYAISIPTFFGLVTFATYDLTNLVMLQ
jgi:uncharacterized membrane protein